MPIKGITDVHTKISAVGKIRTGIKIKNPDPSKRDFPEEVSYFVLNPLTEVTDKKGNPLIDPSTGKPRVVVNDDLQLAIEKLGTSTPNQLTIVFPMDPLDNDDLLLSAYMKWWGKGTLKCMGDGEYAHFKGTEAVEGLCDLSKEPKLLGPLNWPANRICNREQCAQAQSGLCKTEMNMKFMIPDVSLMKLFQLDSKSFQAVSEIFTDLEILKTQLISQKINSLAGIPLTLYRQERKNTRGPKGVTGKNFIVKVKFAERRFEQEKKKLSDGEHSFLSFGQNDLFSIEHIDPSEPNYDLLPKSEHGRSQTGELEPPVDYKPPKNTPESWVEDPKIIGKFKAYATQLGTKVTKAKMLARAKNFATKKELVVYLEDQLKKGSDILQSPKST